MTEQREPWELTDEKLNKAFDSAFDAPLYLDHKPTPDDLITLRLKAVAQAAGQKLLKYLNQRCPHEGWRRRCGTCMADLKAKLEGENEKVNH